MEKLETLAKCPQKRLITPELKGPRGPTNDKKQYSQNPEYNNKLDQSVAGTSTPRSLLAPPKNGAP
jgi:hypothetical protein